MIVIAGAAGQIGSMLAKTFSEQGAVIKKTDTKNDDISTIEKYNLEISVGDISDVDFLIEEFHGATFVYHVVEIISITKEQKQLMEEIDVNGGKSVIVSWQETTIKRLIYTSSVHVLVEIPQGQLIDEPAPIITAKVIGNYVKTKATIRTGFDAMIVYPSGIIRPYFYTISNMRQRIIDYAQGKIPVLIDGTCDFVDVRDIAKGTILAGEKGKRG